MVQFLFQSLLSFLVLSSALLWFSVYLITVSIDDMNRTQMELFELISDIQSVQHDQLERELNIFKSFHNAKINRGKNEK